MNGASTNLSVADSSGLRARALGSLYWVAGGRLTAQLISWVITLWVIRLLSPADYGLVAMASVFVSMCALVDEFGLGATITRATTLDESAVRKALAIVLTVNAVLCGSLLIAAPAVAWFYASPDVAPIVRALALNFLASALGVIPRALMERALQFRRLATVDLIVTLTGAVTTLGLARHGYGVWALVAGVLATTSARAGLLNVVCPFRPLPLWSISGMRGFLSFGGTISLERVVWYVYSQADVFIASKLLGAQAVGFYVVGKHLASLPSQKISPMLQQVVFPVFARIQGDANQVSRGLLQGVNAVSVVAFPIAFGMAAVGVELIVGVLGAQWAPAALPLTGYGLIMPLGMVSAFIMSALKAVGRPDVSLMNVASGSTFMITAFLVGSQWGLEGLSLAWLVAYPLYFLGTVARSSRVLGTTPTVLLSRIARPVVASTVMLVMVAIVRLGTEDAAPDGPVRLALLIAVGVVVYGATMVTFGRTCLLQAVGLVGWKRPSPRQHTL